MTTEAAPITEYRSWAVEEFRAEEEPYYVPVKDEVEVFEAAWRERPPTTSRAPTTSAPTARPCTPIASSKNRAPTSCSTPTTRWTGIRGVKRPSREARRPRTGPVLLSVGYAACHWCHVMERESFEDEEIAEVMNERLLHGIKVDREERPDVDDSVHGRGPCADDRPAAAGR